MCIPTLKVFLGKESWSWEGGNHWTLNVFTPITGNFKHAWPLKNSRFTSKHIRLFSFGEGYHDRSDCVRKWILKLENELFLFVQNFTVEVECPWPLESKSLIGGKCWVQPVSLYPRAWGPKGPTEFEWTKNLHVVLHGLQWIMVHCLPDFASSPP